VFDKTQSFNDGVTRCRTFLTMNDIRQPEFIDTSADEHQQDCRPHDGRPRDFGWYTANKVHVNVKHTRPATVTPGFAWTYPGYKADLTAYGVTAHEVGHHVQAVKHVVREDIRSIVVREPRVTSYEPNANESFAEMMKVFITNPDLLRVGRPLRWAFLTLHLRFKPVDDRPWTDVLAAAHPKFVAAAHNWIKQGGGHG
jgi:hypothetical protein